MAEVRVQAFADYTLRIKMENIRYVTFNGVITMTDAQRIIDLGGQNSGAKEELLGQLRTSLEEPILVHLKRGLIMDFFVSHNDPIAITNIKRSLLSQLQLNVSPGIKNLNMPDDEFHHAHAAYEIKLKKPNYKLDTYEFFATRDYVVKNLALEN